MELPLIIIHLLSEATANRIRLVDGFAAILGRTDDWDEDDAKASQLPERPGQPTTGVEELRTCLLAFCSDASLRMLRKY